jgi:hypothetical protein
MEGTSCATPIAAGVAGLILEFARQRPLCGEPAIESLLKSVDGMRLVMTECFAQKSSRGLDFSHLDPRFGFHVNEHYPDGGHWTDFSSPQHDAAREIVQKLRNWFGNTIGRRMTAAMSQKNSPKST